MTTATEEMLTNRWVELEHRLDTCQTANEAHLEID